MAKLMPIEKFVNELYAAYQREDGYIMGATGQDPKKWAANSWWFTQYTNSTQKKKALYWRDHAARVWDCNGLAEGIYKDYSGTDINSKARYNYAQWCGTKGKGLIPPKYRQPGAAVFWSDSSAGNIHHVAYLFKPVKESKPDGDWYIIEARGVLQGVVMTKLNSRKPNFWGLMTKYFKYPDAPSINPGVILGDRILKNGSGGADVKALQTNLIRLGYDCGRWGADGDFGDATEAALRQFQVDNKLSVDGIFGVKTLQIMEKRLAELDRPTEDPKRVVINGGNCYVRDMPNTYGDILAVAKDGTILDYRGETSEAGWLAVNYNGLDGWVSGKYGSLVG